MNSGRIDIRKAAQLLGLTERHVRRMCIDGKLAGAVKVGGRWKVPVSAAAKSLTVSVHVP